LFTLFEGFEVYIVYMVYRYDQLNRIKQARSVGMAFRTGEPEPYDCDYAYDANGNLLTLKRRDENALVMAEFDYGYEPGTNKLVLLGHNAVADDQIV
jgi:hypothetical protein